MSHQGCAGTAVTRGRIIVPQALGVQTSKKACKVEEARVLSPNLLPSSNGPPPQNRGQVPFGILSKILVPLPTTRHPQPCNKRQSGEGCRTTDVLDPAQGLKLCQPPPPVSMAAIPKAIHRPPFSHSIHTQDPDTQTHMSHDALNRFHKNMAVGPFSEASRSQETGPQSGLAEELRATSLPQKCRWLSTGLEPRPFLEGLLSSFEIPPVPSKLGLGAHSFTRLSTLKLLNFALTAS